MTAKRILYLECNSGISGDMVAGALLDIGADRKRLGAVLDGMPVDGFTVDIRRAEKAGLDVCDFQVNLEDGPDHPEHEGSYHHEHAGHRHFPEILEILERTPMSGKARETAVRIFTILAEAEAKAHGVPAEEVHFHEVGAVDSIVDIVTAAVCLDDLAVDEVVVSPLTEGHGTIRCQHGIIPVPVPAVVNIAADHGLILKPVDIEGELVTPTGAAIAAAVKTMDRLPESVKVLRTGMGAGKRTYSRPNILRAMLLEQSREEPVRESDEIVKLEANIDDSSGETLGYVMEQLLAAGARDVFYTPVYMKKNRPAWLLSVICTEEDREKMEEMLFRETTTIGIRRTKMLRSVMERRTEVKDTPFGPVRMKICRYGNIEKAYPEYEDLARICRERGLSYPEVYAAAAAGKRQQD